MRPELTGTAHAGLHFVKDQQQAEFVGCGAQTSQILDIGGADAAFALDRFYDDGGGLAADRIAQLV